MCLTLTFNVKHEHLELKIIFQAIFFKLITLNAPNCMGGHTKSNEMHRFFSFGRTMQAITTMHGTEKKIWPK